MSRFWGRLASVAVSRDVPLLPVEASSPLRIQFKVEKQPYTPPNTADISIFNLAADTRKYMQKFGADVELRAGYETDAGHLPILFRGQARTVDHVRRGTEWVTRIQCGDGEIPYRYAQVNQAWAPGASLGSIAKYMAEQLVGSGVDVSSFLSRLASGQLTFQMNQQFATGYASQGNALEELEKVLAPEGWLVSIQNGELQVITAGGVTPKRAILVSARTGMVGSPEHGSPDKNGLPSILKVSSLLLPKLGSGDAFVLSGGEIAGNYRAQKVVHTGDTHGGDWKTDIEARPVGAEAAAAFQSVDLFGAQ